MENSPEHTEKIIQYLDGELTGSELAEFEKLLTSDNTVRDELDNLGLARDAVQSYGLRQQVSAVHQEMMVELKSGGDEAPRACLSLFCRSVSISTQPSIRQICTGTVISLTS
jgi:anti-sigma factor RsiW